jgi:hypothetical protein
MRQSVPDMGVLQNAYEYDDRDQHQEHD